MTYTGKTLTSAAAAEPLTVTDNLLREQLRVDHTSDNTLLGLQITAARERVERVTGRALITQTWTAYWDSFPGSDTIELPRPPLQSVTYVKYYDTDDTVATFSSANYDVDITGMVGLVRLKYALNWPTTTLRPTKGVEIQFVCGFGTAGSSVPGGLLQAVVLEVAQAYYGEDETRARRIESLLAPWVVYE